LICEFWLWHKDFQLPDCKKNEKMKNKQYDRREFIKMMGTCAAASLFTNPLFSMSAIQKKRKPNIIFILADDLGWVDTTVYGSKFYETPNVDRLAKKGMRFSDAYAANPLCSPTRASILTGQYPCRIGITKPNCHLNPVQTNTFLQTTAKPTAKLLIPSTKNRLQLEYFTTGEALKEAGYSTALFGKWHLGHEPYQPVNHGFDVNEPGGSYPGPPSYFSPYRMKDFKDGPEGEHIGERLAESAVAFMEKNKDKPFFLNFWNFSVHGPFQGKEKLIDKYKKKVDQKNPQNCPTMGSMVESMDNSVGKILDSVEKLGLEKDTIIIFFSDNGGNIHSNVDGTSPTNNYPLRCGKASIYEGGVRVPMIVVWPGVVKPESKSSSFVSSVDFYPTILEMAGVKPKPGQICDGGSLVPILENPKAKVRNTVFCHFPHSIPATKNKPGTSVRKGDWKLIKFYADNLDKTDRFELYNLKEDIGESKNLAKQNPEIVDSLDKLIVKHIKDTNAIIPVANPRYNPTNTDSAFNWKSQKNCELIENNGNLKVKVTGKNPSFQTRKVPKAIGPIKIRFRMKADVAGKGRLFWSTNKKRTFKGNFEKFSINRDKKWHEYSVCLSKIPKNNALKKLRINPGTGVGTGTGIVEFDWIRVETPGGAILKEWTFD